MAWRVKVDPTAFVVGAKVIQLTPRWFDPQWFDIGRPGWAEIVSHVQHNAGASTRRCELAEETNHLRPGKTSKAGASAAERPLMCASRQGCAPRKRFPTTRGHCYPHPGLTALSQQRALQGDYYRGPGGRNKYHGRRLKSTQYHRVILMTPRTVGLPPPSEARGWEKAKLVAAPERSSHAAGGPSHHGQNLSTEN